MTHRELAEQMLACKVSIDHQIKVFGESDRQVEISRTMEDAINALGFDIVPAEDGKFSLEVNIF